MNFLPFVAALLIILGFASQSLLSQMSLERKMRSSYRGHMNAAWMVASLPDKNFYKNVVPKKIVKKTSSVVPEKKTSLKRQKQLVNITPLLVEGKEARPLLYSFLTRLLVHLYGEQPFFLENPEKTAQILVDALIESAKKQNEPMHLEKLEFKQKKLREIFYKMLKGTRPLHCEKISSEKSPFSSPTSYPSLFQFIYCSCDPKEDHISIAFAAPEILTALFNEEVALRLLQHLAKKQMITKEILEKILQETHFSSTDLLWHSLDFSPIKSHLPIETTSAEDKETHIFITQKRYSRRS